MGPRTGDVGWSVFLSGGIILGGLLLALGVQTVGGIVIGISLLFGALRTAAFRIELRRQRLSSEKDHQKRAGQTLDELISFLVLLGSTIVG